MLTVGGTAAVNVISSCQCNVIGHRRFLIRQLPEDLRCKQTLGAMQQRIPLHHLIRIFEPEIL